MSYARNFNDLRSHRTGKLLLRAGAACQFHHIGIAVNVSFAVPADAVRPSCSRGLPPRRAGICFFDEPSDEATFKTTYLFARAFKQGTDEILVWSDPSVEHMQAPYMHEALEQCDILCPNLRRYLEEKPLEGIVDVEDPEPVSRIKNALQVTVDFTFDVGCDSGALC